MRIYTKYANIPLSLLSETKYDVKMKPAARYAVRAVKYFCWFAVLFTLIISVLVFTKFVPADVETMFVHGWKSVLEICAVFLVFSALYPKFGYQKRLVSIPGEWDGVAQDVKKWFGERGGYRVESETPEKICFRSARAGVRIARLWEDRLTVTPAFGGVEIEGPAKDIARIASAMEYQMNNRTE